MKKIEYFGEHRLDDVIMWLKKLPLDESDITSEIKNDIEKLYHLIYYFEEEQTASFYKAIYDLDNSDFKKVFKNIAYLYPLSKNILMKIIESAPDENSASDKTKVFLNIHEQAEGLTRAYKNTISEIKNLRKGIPSRIEDTEKLITQYEKEKVETQAKIDELKTKAEKENVLYREVLKLKDDFSKLQKDFSDEKLKAKKKELAEIKVKLEKNKKEYQKYAAEIFTLLKEVDACTDYKNKMRDLHNKTKKMGYSENNSEV